MESSTPNIGDNRHWFEGNFDGAGYIISSVSINDKSKDQFGYSAAFQRGGVFNFVGGNAIIKNVNINGCFIYSDNTAGGIVGNTFKRGDSLEVTIENCKVKSGVDVYAYNESGGILGYAKDTTANIRGCECAADVSGSGETDVGGILGYSTGSANISDCYFTGSIYLNGFRGGALIGASYGNLSVSNCYYNSAFKGNVINR